MPGILKCPDMKPCQLLATCSLLLLFTAARCEPVTRYFDTKAITCHYPLRLHVDKDTLNSVWYYQQLAHDLYGRRRFKKAIVQWKRVLHLQPTNAFAMFMLGKSYMGAGEQERGAAICDEAIILSEASTADRHICHSVDGF